MRKENFKLMTIPPPIKNQQTRTLEEIEAILTPRITVEFQPWAHCPCCGNQFLFTKLMRVFGVGERRQVECGCGWGFSFLPIKFSLDWPEFKSAFLDNYTFDI